MVETSSPMAQRRERFSDDEPPQGRWDRASSGRYAPETCSSCDPYGRRGEKKLDRGKRLTGSLQERQHPTQAAAGTAVHNVRLLPRASRNCYDLGPFDVRFSPLEAGCENFPTFET